MISTVFITLNNWIILFKIGCQFFEAKAYKMHTVIIRLNTTFINKFQILVFNAPGHLFDGCKDYYYRKLQQLIHHPFEDGPYRITMPVTMIMPSVNNLFNPILPCPFQILFLPPPLKSKIIISSEDESCLDYKVIQEFVFRNHFISEVSKIKHYRVAHKNVPVFLWR